MSSWPDETAYAAITSVIAMYVRAFSAQQWDPGSRSDFDTVGLADKRRGLEAACVTGDEGKYATSGGRCGWERDSGLCLSVSNPRAA